MLEHAIKREFAPRYAETLGNEIQKAYLESYSEYGQNLFEGMSRPLLKM